MWLMYRIKVLISELIKVLILEWLGGVNALMFFHDQGQKEIDRNEIYNKAQELRKEKEENN